MLKDAVQSDLVLREEPRIMGIDAILGSADQFSWEMRRDSARYGQVVRAAVISVGTFGFEQHF